MQHNYPLPVTLSLEQRSRIAATIAGSASGSKKLSVLYDEKGLKLSEGQALMIQHCLYTPYPSKILVIRDVLTGQPLEIHQDTILSVKIL